MLVVGLRVGMTRDTGKDRKVIGIGMAIITLIPNALMLPAVDREILRIMVKVGWRPSCLAMAGGTVGSKTCCGM